MSVNKFGQTTLGERNQRGPPGVGFKLSEDGDFDLEHKRIINLSSTPKEANDAVSKQYVGDKIKKDIEVFKSEVNSLIIKFINDMEKSIVNNLNNNLKYSLGIVEERLTDKIDTFSKKVTEKLSVKVLNETLKETAVMNSFQDIMIQLKKIIEQAETNAYKDFKYFYVIIKSLDNYIHRMVETQNQNTLDQLNAEVVQINEFRNHVNKYFKRNGLEEIPYFQTAVSFVKLPQHSLLDSNINLNTINSKAQSE